MRRAGLYIMAMMTAGIVMWKTPIISYAEPVMVEANEMEANSEEASPVVEVPTEIDDTANAGPDLEMQNQLREEAEAQQAANQAAETRQNLVNYALQFVGGPYRAGGNDPRTGVDCSGFVKFVMQNGAGIGMNRSSATQATQGKAISANQMQPGDLIFYGSGSHINHVAMYIGNGQIVHASTYKTGIKISNWNYRAPVKIVSMLG
ncbi:MAG: C40 family peptidase [Lachnospiraceae bacterium]|nr:C40 family peptidase [Lachnospiraceae bacterium]MCI9283551.1 C40 family peptidase [Lachnospiraceae bacterium]